MFDRDTLTQSIADLARERIADGVYDDPDILDIAIEAVIADMLPGASPVDVELAY